MGSMARRNWKQGLKKASQEDTEQEDPRQLRETVIKWCSKGFSGDGNSSHDLSPDTKISKCPEQSTSKPLQSPGCPSAELLCSSCLYPCSSTTCTNTLCPLTSTLLTCDLVTNPRSKVRGCPSFRACPECYSLIMHNSGCKYVKCPVCRLSFCFICLETDCKRDSTNYWSLTCAKTRAERQRFTSAQS
ncbi:hypothetical protein DNTS_032205 [Danionella cerebrum]|uniref:IBR domain-containing protein n=1 Tax=Danionella cerebrum TaxID=2873325 RepID=A0A553R3G8_9TELE|nr:hypothetical protein DNTS_032205 [Danionella translucida]